LKTSQSIAQEFKVGHATVERAQKFADAVDTIAEVVSHDIKNLYFSLF